MKQTKKRQIMREFMAGKSTRSLCRLHNVTKPDVEQIIRGKMTKRKGRE